ncbi:hypothetical protein [Absidia glauca]|uniref:C3H1-type domain-containing protein n=1 Tax=Absidia glauca TaxID=4829 RepID=A0A168SZE6_ABSGL|nr:hypothetical protein [Absidia glauca]
MVLPLVCPCLVVMSAIPIVAPSDDPPANSPTSPKSAAHPKPNSKGNPANAKRLCRNVIIHGFCKFEDKGCEFNHDTNNKPAAQLSPESKSSVRLSSPARASTLPSSMVSSVSADSVNAPIFVPKSVADNAARSGTPISSSSGNPTISLEPSDTDVQHQDPNPMPTLTESFSQFDLMGNPAAMPPNFQPPMPQEMMNMMTPNMMDPYFYMNSGYPRQPLQYHLYTSPLPHVGNLHPHQRAIQSFFIPDQLREQLTRRNEATLTPPPVGMDSSIPQEVHVYHSLCPLEDQPGQFFGHPCWVYKATCSVDGRTYALVRIEGFRLAMGSNTMLLPETTLWSYITQISSALKAVHGSGLASRNIDASKILVTGKNRLRINCAGIMDVLQYDGGQNVTRYQQEDLLSFGKLVVALACNSLQSFHNLPQSFEFISRYYSPDLKNLVLFLLSKPQPTKTIDEAIKLIGPRILHEINCSQYYTDTLESELGRELENGRLVRLLSKLGFINERPE